MGLFIIAFNHNSLKEWKNRKNRANQKYFLSYFASDFRFVKRSFPSLLLFSTLLDPELIPLLPKKIDELAFV